MVSYFSLLQELGFVAVHSIPNLFEIEQSYHIYEDGKHYRELPLKMMLFSQEKHPEMLQEVIRTAYSNIGVTSNKPITVNDVSNYVVRAIRKGLDCTKPESADLTSVKSKVEKRSVTWEGYYRTSMFFNVEGAYQQLLNLSIKAVETVSPNNSERISWGLCYVPSLSSPDEKYVLALYVGQLTTLPKNVVPLNYVSERIKEVKKPFIDLKKVIDDDEVKNVLKKRKFEEKTIAYHFSDKCSEESTKDMKLLWYQCILTTYVPKEIPLKLQLKW